jgi:predicted AlkP superfamily phosphohydrolase/phosphomutase
MDLKANSYDMYFPNSHNIKSKPIWEIIGEHGKRSIVVNVPSTYPAKPLNGALISGFVAIDLAKATYPSSLLPKLEKVNYQLDVDATKARESLEVFVEDLDKVFAAREKILWDLLINEQWDLFIGVITETDRMHHYLWVAIEDPQHKFHGFFKSFYSKVDRFIGKVYEWFQGKGVFMIMSDHGFCKIQKEVYLNHWLVSNDYLRFSRENPQSYLDIDKGTKAFNMDPARIYIHLRGKYPSGCISPGKEYDSLREELKSRLMELKVDGFPVVKTVYFKEELFNGSFINDAPDILLLPNWGYDLKGTISKQSLTGNSLLTGMHTQNDSTFYISVKNAFSNRVNIVNIAPTVVKALGIESNQDFDTPSLI